MEFQKRSLVFNLLIVIFVLVTSSGSAYVEFRKSWSTLFELNVTDSCHNLPMDSRDNNVNEIRTDSCLILYYDLNCSSDRSFKLMPGWKEKIYSGLWSLQKCNDKEGGPQLNIDIKVSSYFDEEQDRNTIIQSYHDVCTCQNVPIKILEEYELTLDNHANDLIAYYEPDCAQKYSTPVHIDAGTNHTTRNIFSFWETYGPYTFPIRSFGPNPNATYFRQSCSAYHQDNIMKVDLLETSNSSMATNGSMDNATESQTNWTELKDDPMHFFAKNNYEGFHFGSRSTSKCNNFVKHVQSHWTNGVGSIKTKTCLILHSENNCMGRSVRIEPPGISNLTSLWESTLTGEQSLSLLFTKYPNWNWETKSYHVCNEEEGGSILNVDIFSNKTNDEPIDGLVMLERYENVCTCRNIPEYVKLLDEWSVDNHGNSMMAYFSLDCEESPYSPLWIPAGRSSYSIGLGMFRKVDESTQFSNKIQSIGPDPNAEYFTSHCNKNSGTLGNRNTTKTGIGYNGDLEAQNENTQLGAVMLERMQTLMEKMQQVLENTEVNSQVAQLEIMDILEKQKDDIKKLDDKLNSHINE